MIKIIGGDYRSRNIETPDSATTLPTKNMVRGAMLSSLGDRIEGARVLDLFALGIETLSRGAASCLFAEKDRAAYQIVVKNLASLRETKGEVLNSDYRAALERAKKEGRVFDIVFLDPPYAMKGAYQEAVDFLLDNSMLGEEATLILEYEGDLPFHSDLPFQREYKYGKTKVLALRRSL